MQDLTSCTEFSTIAINNGVITSIMRYKLFAVPGIGKLTCIACQFDDQEEKK